MDMSLFPEVLLPAHMVVRLAVLLLKAQTDPEQTAELGVWLKVRLLRPVAAI